ncbi:MAG: cysteine desulfurase family protein, partial [Pseudomonadota bacterium]|nr:cysteine desulfurase family protein [Pseudomonadota bacterium]
MPVYLDYNASTPVAPEVADAMQPFLRQGFGNPSSRHWASAGLQESLTEARRQVADLLGCKPAEIVFTSGGSEATNHALKGAYFTSGKRDAHIVTTQIEHPATIETCRFLERLGAQVTYLPVDGNGLLDPNDFQRAITRDTILVSVMHANNEVGTIQPIAEVSRIAHEHGVLSHTDAAQSAGKIPVDVTALDVDLLTLAGHKLYAPKGVGALYVREGVEIEPLIHGGGQEDGQRSGTEAVMMAVALGTASHLASKRLTLAKVSETRDYFWSALKDAFGDAVIQNGDLESRLPNTLNVSFIGRDGSKILEQLDGFAASTGSACHEDSVTMSPVLAAMGLSDNVAMGAICCGAADTSVVDDMLATSQGQIMSLCTTAWP